MPEMYRSVFKLPSIRTKDVRAVHPITTQTIAPHAGSLCRYRTQAGDVRSPGSFQGYIRLLKCSGRTGFLLKRRYCTIPVSSFVVRHTQAVVFCYAALPREAEVIFTELTGHAAAIVDAPYKWKLGALQTCPFTY